MPKFTPNIYLSTPDKLKKLASLALETAARKREVESLNKQIETLYAKSSVFVDDE